MLTKPPVLYDFCVADPISCSGNSRFPPGEVPSRGMDLFEALLVDITQSAAYFVLDHVSLCVSAGLRML